MVDAKDQTAAQFYSDERHIEMWRVKRLINMLDNTRGYVQMHNLERTRLIL